LTVLAEYQRLEAEGVWRPDPEAQRRNVVVSIGEATLTISDFNGSALTHWSLPAVQRLNPGERPALYGPGDDAPETLEVSDDEMVAALNRVLKAIRRGAARPGRVRGLTTLAVFLGATAIAVFWLPGAIVRHTASLVPESARTGIGAALVEEVETVAGAACDNPSGQRALSRLSDVLFPGKPTTLVVLPSALTGTASLPGGTILISHTLVEDYETPEVLAGYLIAEDMRRTRQDPLTELLKAAGLKAALTLLTTGKLSEDTLSPMSEWLVSHPSARIPQPVLAMRMKEAGVSGKPYALAVDYTGKTTDTVADAIPATPRPVLEDGDWIALQRICED
jgi:hypothetical protein